jgi:hypothetical protein
MTGSEENLKKFIFGTEGEKQEIILIPEVRIC